MQCDSVSPELALVQVRQPSTLLNGDKGVAPHGQDAELKLLDSLQQDCNDAAMLLPI